MINRSKVNSLAAVVGACVALFAAAPANAYVYSVSKLEVKDLEVIFAHADNSIATATSLTYKFDLANSATFNGLNAVTSGTCSGNGLTLATTCGASPSILNALVATAPLSERTRSENSFAFMGVLPVLKSYSNADSLISDAALVTGSPTATNQIAESLLYSNGAAKANSEVQSSTNLTLDFTVAGVNKMTIKFKANTDQFVEITETTGLNFAQTNRKAAFTLQKRVGLTNLFASVATWEPDGSTSTGCTAALGYSCSETDDAEDLTDQFSIGFNPSASQYSFPGYGDLADTGSGPGFGLYEVTISGLADGDYSLALDQLVSTSVERAVVPEPGSLALVGLALAGLGAIGLRRGKSTNA